VQHIALKKVSLGYKMKYVTCMSNLLFFRYKENHVFSFHLGRHGIIFSYETAKNLNKTKWNKTSNL